MNFSIGQTIKHAILILGALIVIAPFYTMVSYSFKSQREIETGADTGFFGSQEVIIDESFVFIEDNQREKK